MLNPVVVRLNNSRASGHVDELDETLSTIARTNS